MSTLKEQNQALYDLLLNDKRDSNPRFVAMKKAYQQLAGQELDDENQLAENVSMLGRVLDFAKIYIRNHGGLHATTKGRERYAWAKQLRDMTKELYDRKKEELNRRIDREKQQIRANPEVPGQLERLAKLQRCIGTAEFKPKVNDFQLKPSLWQRFKGRVEHGLSHLFNGAFGLTVGLATTVVVAPFTTTGKYQTTANAQESDMSLVPGSKTGEHFEQLHPENENDDQEICGDTRRVPINYEEIIPEDPDQPPTMTLCFEQGDEGKTKAQGNEKGQGHAFISLKYTRKNPLNGKPERYKCTFGFYPHQNIHSLRVFAAMGADGLVMPGGVENDNDHSYSTSKTFQVSNKIINTVFQSAGDYAKGGYSYLTRSCATFAHDMAVAAGLPADDFFAKTDFEGKRSDAMKIGTLVGTTTIGRLGKHSLLKHADETITRYERFGQHVINREDVQRLSTRKLNARLKGYVPSVATEAARNDWDFHLDSNRYQPKIAEDDEKDVTYSGWELGNARMMKEQMNLLHTVERFLKKNRVPRDQVRQLTDNLTEFMATNDSVIANYARTAFPEDYEWGENEKPTNSQSMDAIRGGAKAIKNYIEGLDHIFRTTFKSDARLNIGFQHMVSTLRGLDNSFAEQYRTTRNKFFSKAHDANYFHDRDVTGYLDAKKENFTALARLNFSRSKLYSRSLGYNSKNSYRPEVIAGLVKSFGSLENFMRKEKELDETKTRLGEKSKSYRKLSDDYSEALATAEQFGQAMRVMAGKQEYNHHDVEFAFRELPQGIGDVTISYSNSDPSEIYQLMILSSYFPGLREACNASLINAKKNYFKEMDRLDSMRDMLSLRDYAKKLSTLQYKTQQQIAAGVFGFVAEKLKACPELDTIVNRIKETKYREDGINPETTPAADRAGTENAAFNYLAQLLCDGMVKPILEDVSEKLTLKGAPEREAKFDDLIENSVNPTKLEIIEGAKPLMDLLRGKYVEGALYTPEEAETFMQREKKQILSDNLNTLRSDKKPEDMQALDGLKAAHEKKLTAVARKNGMSADSPEVQDALSELIVCRIISSTLRHSERGLEEKVNEEMLSRETSKLKKYGVFQALSKPENAELVSQAIGGKSEAQFGLVQKILESVEKIDKKTKKNIDSKLEAREKFGEEIGLSTETASKLQRRLSLSEKRGGSPMIP